MNSIILTASLSLMLWPTSSDAQNTRRGDITQVEELKPAFGAKLEPTEVEQHVFMLGGSALQNNATTTFANNFLNLQKNLQGSWKTHMYFGDGNLLGALPIDKASMREM